MSGIVLLYPAESTMSEHTDAPVNREVLGINDLQGVTEILKGWGGGDVERGWFDRKTKNVIDSKVRDWLNSEVPSSSPLTLNSLYPPFPPEYVVTLTYGLGMTYCLNSKNVRMEDGKTVVMDARNVMHGVCEVGGEGGVEVGGKRWRVGVVAWRMMEKRRGGGEEEEVVKMRGLWGEESESEEEDC